MSGAPRRPPLPPTSLADADAGADAWNRVVATAQHGDPFSCRSEWQLSFHEVFAPGRPLHVLADGRSAIAFCSTFAPRLGPLLEPVECSWLFGCPLLGPDAPALLAELLARAAPNPAGRPSVLVSGVLPHAALRRQLLTLPGRYTPLWLAPGTLAFASLKGGLDGYLSRRSAKVRRNVRAAARRARDAGVRFERHAPTDAAAADAVYDRMLAVERRSWKGVGRCGMAEHPSRPFYRALLRRLARGGRARVILAHHERDGDVGFVFGGMHRGVYRGQQFSYVEGWRRASLGNVLQLEKVRWLGEQGARRYDMGPMMPYKRHWTEATRRVGALLLRADD